MEEGRWRRAWGATKRYWPELLLVGLGLALRATMAVNYDVRWGYDFGDHWLNVEWYSTHSGLPPLTMSRTADHPPLFYWLAAAAYRAGVTQARMNFISLACGSLRLLVIWFGLERNLPFSRAARLMGLAIVSVMPSSIHLDGMVSNEGLNNLLAAIVTVLMAELVRAEGRRRWLIALAMGLVAGLELLTKVSGLVLIGAGGLAATVELWWVGHDGWRGRLRRLLTWVAALAVVLAVSGWLFVYNQRANGKMFVTGFEGPDAAYFAPIEHVPYLERRKPNFFYGWSNAIYSSPYWPAAVEPTSYFWPPLVASTFVDYYSYHFAGNKQPTEIKNARDVPLRASQASGYSALGGTWIAAVTVIAWLATALVVFRRREAAALPLLFVPLVALAGQLHFAVKYAVDAQGPIKGLYMQFAAVPLYGLFGLGATWPLRLRRGWVGWVLLLPSLAALLPVTAYVLIARLG